MLEQIIITSLFASAVVFLLYKWRLVFWKCDYCIGFWVGMGFALLRFSSNSNLDNVAILALCASIPTFLIVTTILKRYDDNNFTGRY